MITYNLPDSLYHFPTKADDPLYIPRLSDFLFPSAYNEKYPIRFSYEIVPESDRRYFPCLGIIDLSHYAHTVKKEIKIKCARK